MLGRGAIFWEILMVLVPSALPSSLCLAKTEQKKLPEPSLESSLETAIKEIAGIAVRDDKIALLPEGKALFLSLNLNRNGKTREAIFGPIEAQVRRPLIAGPITADLVGADLVGADLVGADLVGPRWLILDGTEVSVREVASSDYSEVTKRTVAWDLIKPPADRGGEPTRAETSALRTRFGKSWRRTPGRKIAGWARRTGDAKKDEGFTYLLATTIPSFPVLEMRCGGGGESSSCLITRQCFVEGINDIKSTSVAGIAYSRNKKLVYLGDAEQHKVHVFRFESCFHIVKVRELVLPDKLKKLTNLYVDEGDRLWLTTTSPDDYLNASVYYWPL